MKVNMISILWTFCLILLKPSWAQSLSGAPAFVDYPGLSSPCKAAMGINVTCPMFLNSVSQNGAILDDASVQELCTQSCDYSLKDAQITIKSACGAPSDQIVVDSIAYPATLVIDNFLHAYKVSCKTDKHTGQFCDPQLRNWTLQGYPLTTNQTCSDCWLGAQAIQMNSPLGYDSKLADNLASMTSKCNATVGYSFTTPTPYALNSTSSSNLSPTTATSGSSCIDQYTVQSSDDCNSVALAHNVSTYSLTSENYLDLYCNNFAATVNSTICLPEKCTPYVWKGNDTCDSVVSLLEGVTVTEFLSWNPMFNTLCLNTDSFVGNVVCLSPPGNDLDPTITPGRNSTGEGSSATAPVPAPTNAMNGTKQYCGRWYTVMEGDTCARISVANSISMFDFYFLNPELSRNCSNLEVDESYCIEAVGNIATYSGYPVTTPRITVTPASFPSVNTGIPTPSSNPGFVATWAYLPHASGTPNNCQNYQNYTKGLDDCRDVAGLWGINTAKLASWNPSLSSNQTLCQLEPGLSYCVQNDDATDSTTTKQHRHGRHHHV